MTPLGLTFPPELIDAIAERVAELVTEGVGQAGGAPSPWLDPDEAAARLKCGRRRIYDLVQQDRIPYRREGNRLLFRADELDAWIDSGDAAGSEIPARSAT